MTALRVRLKRASVSGDWLPRFCRTRVVTTPRCFYNQMFSHPNFFTPKCFHTQMFPHPNVSTSKCFYTQMFPRPNVSTPKCSHTQMLLHPNVTTPKCFQTQMSSNLGFCCTARPAPWAHLSISHLGEISSLLLLNWNLPNPVVRPV